MIEYYCEECGKVVAKVKEANGTFFIKGIILLCNDCYIPPVKKDGSQYDYKYKANDSDAFKNIFGTIFGGKK